MKFKKQYVNQLLRQLVFTNLSKIYINDKMTLFSEYTYYSRRGHQENSVNIPINLVFSYFQCWFSYTNTTEVNQ